MNLTSLFNFKFMKENLKRSKAIILLCIFLVPIINMIMYLMKVTNETSFVINLFEVSSLSCFALYLIPVILSITLFSFVYKRKSSDFVISMPISKKQIFMTNTLSGIIILLILNIINYLFILIVTLLFNNVLVSYAMLFDIFLIWTISYIFVFVCTNIAVAVSSNRVTTIVVTMLLLFLVPFVHTFISHNGFNNNVDINVLCKNENCIPNSYECYNDFCENNLRNNIYDGTSLSKINKSNYTLPYAFISSLILRIDDQYDIGSSLIKMGILSILYIVVGLILFNRKKFEIVDTSFRSERVHLFVRWLTLTPIICICYVIFVNSSLSLYDTLTLVFLLVVIITYLIIYDLLTRKKVTNIFKGLASIIIMTMLVVFTGKLSYKESYLIDVNDIERITFNSDYLSNNEGYTSDEDIINYVMAILTSDKIDDIYASFELIIDTSDNKYHGRIVVNEDEYKKLVNLLDNDETYKNSSKTFDNKKVFGIGINDILNISKDSELYDKLLEKYKNNGFSNSTSSDGKSDLFDVTLYVYDDFNIKNISFNVYGDDKLEEEILNSYNSVTYELFKNKDVVNYSYYVGGDDLSKYFSSNNYSKLDKFIIDNANSKIDAYKDYMYVRVYNNYGNYIFVTNKTYELKELLNEIGSLDEDVNFDTGDIDEKFNG